MKKSMLNIGKALSKAEQRTINGGLTLCPTGYCPPKPPGGFGCDPICVEGVCLWRTTNCDF